ncbi:hypothetical protein BH11MYX2_BH11MYX2_00580 [soil metagenome]
MSDTLPKPSHKPVNFDQIKSVDQASDYALGGYHAALAQSSKNNGPESRLWKDAADAYAAAYGTILGTRALPGDQGLQKATEALHQANHLSDQAKTSHRQS